MKSKNYINDNEIILGNKVTLEDAISVSRYNAKVTFNNDFINRVQKARNLIEKWINEDVKIYGVNTGFGSLCDKIISKADIEKLQQNIILTHATSVGDPLAIEQVRSIMFMMLLNMGQGYSGVRIELLNRLKVLLNNNIIPYVPKEGSVGYLSLEAHIGLVIIGRGKVYYNDKLSPTQSVYNKLNIKPLKLHAKEGLSLISGTTSPTGLAALALHDMLNATKSADIIAAMSIEVLKGTLKAFDDNLMSVRQYCDQRNTATNIRNILSSSDLAKENIDYRLQDALSIRGIPQLHGASKKTLNDALETLENEMNSCNDNPIIWTEEGNEKAISGCNCDASYVGLAMDSASIASTMIAKISERRNCRLINNRFSEMPSFLIKNPGINSGLMIPQYSQAGLLNDMKILSHPATVDSIPTSNGQEDYVSMGYNAAKKACEIAKKLEYILAIELLSVYQAQQFLDEPSKVSNITKKIYHEINKYVPIIEEDVELHSHIEQLKNLVHDETLIQLANSELERLY